MIPFFSASLLCLGILCIVVAWRLQYDEIFKRALVRSTKLYADVRRTSTIGHNITGLGSKVHSGIDLDRNEPNPRHKPDEDSPDSDIEE